MWNFEYNKGVVTDVGLGCYTDVGGLVFFFFFFFFFLKCRILGGKIRTVGGHSSNHFYYFSIFFKK